MNQFRKFPHDCAEKGRSILYLASVRQSCFNRRTLQQTHKGYRLLQTEDNAFAALQVLFQTLQLKSGWAVATGCILGRRFKRTWDYKRMKIFNFSLELSAEMSKDISYGRDEPAMLE